MKRLFYRLASSADRRGIGGIALAGLITRCCLSAAVGTAIAVSRR